MYVVITLYLTSEQFVFQNDVYILNKHSKMHINKRYC